MSVHKEIYFETEICDYLKSHGWLYEEKDASNFRRGLSLYPDDVIAWVQTTQPDEWAKLQKNHGASAADTLLNRLRYALDLQGTLQVLRNGFDVLGLQKSLRIAQFKPANAMNSEIIGRYAANRLRVVRQVKYSLHNENSIDLVLLLNGVPVATAELKTDFTQSIRDAIDQYRYDRDPAPKGQAAESLLSFPGGALVHFAVSNSEVHMTTRLQGKQTAFLPFNKGNNGGKGNPPNAAGHPTSYLWEEVWERESWLEILGRYLVAEKDAKKQLKRIIFPRFHQLDATRKLQAAILQEGAGEKYLIQHSAGSGKTNSIAWTAHFLADLHDAQNQKVFDSVLVVSDRNVIDGQLQDAIFSFERTAGVVATIKGDGGSKSAELAEALSGDKKIVVCTIQTFPFALKAVRELAATSGKRFAVIADEAHSSQTGEAASKLKQVLSAEELKELDDGGEVSIDDLLAAQMANRASEKGVTYIAFTATPKAKTLELFGRRPDPTKPAGEGNLPLPFHVYSMRQAIEEEFILDVLQNYTSFKLAFRLASGGRELNDDDSKKQSGQGSGKKKSSAKAGDFDGKELTDREVERSAAMKGLMNWVRLHPYNIAQKVQVVVEHYRQTVQPLLQGRAKAMVVVGSRLEAVRWQLAIDKYIQERGYPLRTLVAFSGEVNDIESGPEPFRESSIALNPTLKGRDIREAFKGDEFQILLVANKFQTGFDQPLLCGMYIDKRLAGIQAVQTLSRLNRCHPGKDKTYVLDFVNEPGEILAAFKTYYTTAELSDATDPNLILNLKAKLDGLGYYDQFEVDRVVAVELDPAAKQSQLHAAVKPVAERLVIRYRDAKEAYREATLASGMAESGTAISAASGLLQSGAAQSGALASGSLESSSLKSGVGQGSAAQFGAIQGDVSPSSLSASGASKKNASLEEAKGVMDALILFKTDIGTYQRAYAFLSQIFDYGNTEFEKRAIFYKHLYRLLEFGREREGVDLSQVVLTHHSLKSQGKQKMSLAVGEQPKLAPMTEAGSGSVQEKEKAYLSEIIAKLNDLFQGDLSDGDKLVYVNNVIRGKLLESDVLRKQAANNSKEQFGASPDLKPETMNAVIEALDAHHAMSSQALSSEAVLMGLIQFMLGPGRLYEALRGEA